MREKTEGDLGLEHGRLNLKLSGPICFILLMFSIFGSGNLVWDFSLW